MINEAYALLRTIELKVNHSCTVSVSVTVPNVLHFETLANIKRKNKIVRVPFDVSFPFYQDELHFIAHYIDVINRKIREAYESN